MCREGGPVFRKGRGVLKSNFPLKIRCSRFLTFEKVQLLFKSLYSVPSCIADWYSVRQRLTADVGIKVANAFSWNMK